MVHTQQEKLIKHLYPLHLLFLLVSCFLQLSLQGMIYDNRFWPLYPERFLTYQACPYATWYWSARGVFIGADRGFLSEELGEDEGGLFEIFGKYDEIVLNRALVESGVIAESLLRPDFETLGEIPWDFNGKMSLRGCAIESEGYILPFLSIGGSLFVGHMQSHKNGFLTHKIIQMLGPGDLQELRTADAAIHQALQVDPPCWSTLAFGDIDLYFKGRFFRDYWYKMHHFDIAFRLGFYLPSGERGSRYNPVSLPIGGNGHFGIYGQCDVNIVLNDLLSTGFLLQGIKRLPRTSTQRMPVLTEPTNYGVLLAPARVDPGLTLVFNPYVQIGGLRNGLGAFFGYNLVHHSQDTWCVSDEILTTKKPNLKLLEQRSKWGSDHFTAGLWYDFGYDCEKVWHKPVISVMVEIPWQGPVTHMVPKAHSVSLRIESQL